MSSSGDEVQHFSVGPVKEDTQRQGRLPFEVRSLRRVLFSMRPVFSLRSRPPWTLLSLLTADDDSRTLEAL